MRQDFRILLTSGELRLVESAELVFFLSIGENPGAKNCTSVDDFNMFSMFRAQNIFPASRTGEEIKFGPRLRCGGQFWGCVFAVAQGHSHD